jgi:hypothetical protein
MTTATATYAPGDVIRISAVSHTDEARPPAPLAFTPVWISEFSGVTTSTVLTMDVRANPAVTNANAKQQPYWVRAILFLALFLIVVGLAFGIALPGPLTGIVFPVGLTLLFAIGLIRRFEG